MNSNVPYIAKVLRLWSRLKRARNAFFNKGHAWASIGAILISACSVFYTWRATTVDIADKQYLFWDKINSSYKAQQHTLQELYPMLWLKSVKAVYISRYIHGDTLSCQAFAERGGQESHTRKIGRPLQSVTSIGLTKYEDEEESTLQTTTLELGYLALSLRPKGWNEFLANTAYSYVWWNRLSWDTMQLSFFPSVWRWNCTSSRKQLKINNIKISKKSARRFRRDIKIVFRWLPVIKGGETPNLISIIYLEKRNVSRNDLGNNTVHKFYGAQPLSIMNDDISKILYIISTVSESHKSGNK